MTVLKSTWHVVGKIPLALGFLGFFLVELVRSSLRVAHDCIHLVVHCTPHRDGLLFFVRELPT